jgi:acyl-CoA synthetase (AMP-forming)/AMP-acid ligase II
MTPRAVALVDAASGREIRYAQLDHMIGRVAAGVVAQGLGPSDTLLMLAPNLPQWPMVVLGAMAAGGMVSGANPMAPIDDLVHQMREATARFVCMTPQLLATAREAATRAGCEHIVLIGGVGRRHGRPGLARLVDPDSGNDAATAAPGELRFRGPQAFKSYLNQPESAAATITADGWVRTGDIGRIDANGYAKWHPRATDLVVAAGLVGPLPTVERQQGRRPQSGKSRAPGAVRVGGGAVESGLVRAPK